MKSKGNWVRRALAGLVAGMALMALNACGGGTDQITPFAPKRLLVLGDEMSVLTKAAPQGRKYSVNALQADNTSIDCVALPVWHQIIADTYDFAYEECNPTGQAETTARIYALPGAKVSDLVGQFARAVLVNGNFSNTDLFTVLVGANDVLELYENVYMRDPTTETYNAVIAELQARGRRLGQFVNDLTRLEVTGPKVIVSTIPLMDLTPYALREAIAHPLVPVSNSLREFSRAFNTAMRVTIVNDGRFIGLVELDALINAGAGDPLRYGLVNSVQAVCAVDLPDCDNTATDLVPGGNATTWLWASDLWMGPTAHLNLGNFARGRATDNPF